MASGMEFERFYALSWAREFFNRNNQNLSLLLCSYKWLYFPFILQLNSKLISFEVGTSFDAHFITSKLSGLIHKSRYFYHVS